MYINNIINDYKNIYKTDEQDVLCDACLYIYMSARSSYTFNEVLQNINIYICY